MHLIRSGLTAPVINKFLSQIYHEFPSLNKAHHQMLMCFDREYEGIYTKKKAFLAHNRKALTFFLIKLLIVIFSPSAAIQIILFKVYGVKSLLFVFSIALGLVLFSLIHEIVNRCQFNTHGH